MTPLRREMLDLLTSLVQKYPDMRLGQIVANFTSLSSSEFGNSVYDIEDEDLAASMRLHLTPDETEQLAIPA